MSSSPSAASSTSSSVSRFSSSSSVCAHLIEVLTQKIDACHRQVRTLQRKCTECLVNNDRIQAHFMLELAQQTSQSVNMLFEMRTLCTSVQEQLCAQSLRLSHCENMLTLHRELADHRIRSLEAAVETLQADRAAHKRTRDDSVPDLALQPKQHCAAYQAAAFVASKISDAAFGVLEKIILAAANKAGFALKPDAQPIRVLRDFKQWLDLLTEEGTDYICTLVARGATVAVHNPGAAASIVFAGTVYTYMDPKTLVAGPWLRYVVKEILRTIVCKTLPEPWSTMLYWTPLP